MHLKQTVSELYLIKSKDTEDQADWPSWELFVFSKRKTQNIFQLFNWKKNKKGQIKYVETSGACN